MQWFAFLCCQKVGLKGKMRKHSPLVIEDDRIGGLNGTV